MAEIENAEIVRRYLYVPDDILYRIGSDGDIVLVNRSTTLAANTALANVLIGTPVTPAIDANSLILSNRTASGDILVAANRGGNSENYIFVDSSAGTLTLYAPNGAITLSPTTSVIVPDGTAAAPGLRTTTEAHGIYRASATQLGFSAAGVAVANVSSVGVFRFLETVNGGQSVLVVTPASSQLDFNRNTDGVNLGRLVWPAYVQLSALGSSLALQLRSHSGAIQLGINDFNPILTIAAASGATSITTLATSGGASSLTITAGAHTAVTAEVLDMSVVAHTLTYTGSYATQRFVNIAQPTLSAASALTVTTAVTFNIDAAPTVASSGRVTNVFAARIGGATTIFNIAGTVYAAIVVPAHTVTLSQTTQATGNPTFRTIDIEQVTVNQSGGAVTVDSVASVYVAGPLIAGASVTITNNYSVWVDNGSVRLDGSLWVESTPTEGTAGEQLTSGGAGAVMTWDAAACIRESKEQVQLWDNPAEALDVLLTTPIYRFRYKDVQNRQNLPGLSDRSTVYVGPMADESPWAMHYNGRILNPINALGYTVLSIQALYKELEELKRKYARY